MIASTPVDPPSLRVRPERLWETLEKTALVGTVSDGGVRRLALSAEDGALRDLVVGWCREAGCEVTVDGVGNIFARRRGSCDALPPVVVGSHLDSQLSAGPYDGVLGVLAGLELIRSLNDQGLILRRPVEVVSWTNEEGARFRPPMMGSSAFTGVLSPASVLATRDEAGVSVREALVAIGFAGDRRVGARRLDSYWELHIEQSRGLERDGIAVGIPSCGYATRALEITITGKTAHAGPTPMPERRNALVGAAHMAIAIDRIAREHAPDAKSTSTRLETWPNLPGIIPSKATLLADLRHPGESVVEQMINAVEHAAVEAARAANVTIAVEETYSFGGLTFDESLVTLIEQIADEHDVSHRRLWSQAGHDAYLLSAWCPTAMVFCPCRDGISHNPAESVDIEQIAPAIQVFADAVVRWANRDA